MRNIFVRSNLRLLLAISPAIIGFLTHIWLAAPGFVSFDAASQFAQTQSGRMDNMHPIAMTLLWQLINWMMPGPPGSFGMLLVQDLMYFGAIAWIASTLATRTSAVKPLLYLCAAVLLLCFWPPFFALQAHIWKDCLLASAWLLAIAALLSELLQTHGARRWKLWLALMLFGFGALLRHNALLALPPVIFWIASRFEIKRRWLKLALSMVVMPIVLLANRALVVGFDAKASPVWAVTAIFDLSAEAIATGEWYVPAHLRVDAPMEEFGRAFKSYSGVPLFSATLIVDGVSGPLSDADQAILFRNWLTLPLRSPKAYFAHRLRVAKFFLWPSSDESPTTLWFVPSALPQPDRRDHGEPILFAYPQLFQALGRQLWCSQGLYVLAGAALWLASRRRKDANARFAHILLLSAACFFLPLLVLINAAEFRYGYYMMLCVMLSGILLGLKFTLPSKASNAQAELNAC